MKVFIKKTSEYSCKNKLQKLILDSMKELDCTLCDNEQQAIKLIKLAYNLAVQEYDGKAKVPGLTTYKPSDTSVTFYVQDVVYLSVYPCHRDLTENNINP
jgi:hypothetical protein